MGMPNESLVDINLGKLEEHWRDQPAKVIRYGKRLSRARKKLAEAKAHFDLVKNELSYRARKDPELYGVQVSKRGITEKAIEEVVVMHRKYRRAQQEYIDAESVVEDLKVVMKALDHLKSSLEGEVTLFCAQYWAKPSEPKDAGGKHHMRDLKKRSLRDETNLSREDDDD